MPSEGEDYYNDGPASPAAAGGDEPKEKEGNEDRPTFIVPKSAFGSRDVKPGDKCDFEVCMVHENDVEMYPCEGEGDNHDEKPKMDEPAPSGDEGGMSSMME